MQTLATVIYIRYYILQSFTFFYMIPILALQREVLLYLLFNFNSKFEAGLITFFSYMLIVTDLKLRKACK